MPPAAREYLRDCFFDDIQRLDNILDADFCSLWGFTQR